MRTLLLSGLLFCYALAAYSQSAPISSGEYYIDTDPGPGNGTAIPLTTADNISETLSISTSSLPSGYHRLYIRYVNAAGMWGNTVSTQLFKVFAPADTNTAIVSGEYFVDTDPGPGNGTVISVSTGDSITNNLSIATSGYAAGQHRFYIRYKSANGKWGNTASRFFIVTNADTAIVSGEYFVDIDPGAGNGTAIAATAGDSVLNNLSISTSSFSYGLHSVYVRYLTRKGKWGSTASTLICALPSIAGVSTICTGTPATLSDAATGGTWSSGNTGIAVIDPAAGTVTPVTTGVSVITYTYSAGCSITDTVTVISSPGAITGMTTVCAGSTLTLSDAGGGIWNTGSTDIATVNSGGVVTGVSAGIVAVSYTLSCGIATTNITVHPLPVISAGAGISICPGSSATLTATGGDTYSWAPSTGLSATIGASVIANPVSTTIYTITGSSAGCYNEGTITATVLPEYTISASAGANGSISPSGTAGLCSGAGQLYTITPNAGYHINEVVVDGGSIGAAGSYTFTSVSANHIISATFASDCMPPSIAICPGNITADNATGICSAIVSYAAATINGTFPTITYSQNPGTSFFVGVTTVTVTAANSCGTATCNFTVTVNDTTTPTITAPANVIINGYCMPLAVALGTPITGDNCGVASVTNDAPATFPAGITTVHWTVTDMHGNTATATQTVTVNPGTLSLSATTTNENCNGGSNGGITTTISGGTMPYTYSWSNGAATANLAAIAAHTYSVTATDAHGCTATGSYTVTQPATLTFAATIDNVTCHGIPDGSVAVAATGGTSPYAYTWSTGGSGLALGDELYLAPAGVYTVTVTDAHRCSFTTAYTITQPAALGITATTANVSCYGGGNGSINTTVTGGTSAYSYLWSTGAHTADPSGLSPGIYLVAVTDAHGCITGGAYTITQPAALSLPASAANVTCYGGKSGSITTTVSGGTPGYTYSWSTGSHLANLTALAAGIYTLTVTDSHGCTALHIYTITQPAALSLTAIVTNASCYGCCNGNINTTVTGGPPPYGYIWSNGSRVADPAGLCAAVYSVTATDALGCAIEGSYTVTQPTKGKSGARTSFGDDDSTSGFSNIRGSDDEIKVYPNPNDGVFTMLLLSAIDEQVQVTITDIAGQKVKEFTTTTNKAADIKFDAASGIYFLSAVTTHGKYVVKVTVE